MKPPSRRLRNAKLEGPTEVRARPPGRRAHDGAEDFQLRKIDAKIAKEQSRPSPAGEDDALAVDAATLGDHGADAPRRGLEPRTAHWVSTCAPALAAAAAIAGAARAGSARPSVAVKSALRPFARRARQQRIDLVSFKRRAPSLIVARAFVPRLARRDLPLRIVEIGDAALRESRCRRPSPG